jgi:hypothetical protein
MHEAVIRYFKENALGNQRIIPGMVLSDVKKTKKPINLLNKTLLL